MVALDLLGRRGALRVLWELRGDPMTFRVLQSASEMNPASLNKRLKEFRELEIVEHGDGGYCLTAQGKSLMSALSPLQEWAGRWAERLDAEPAHEAPSSPRGPAR